MKTLLTLLLFLKASAVLALADEPPLCPQPLNVGSYGCCYFRQPDGGIDVEMLTALMERANCGVRVFNMPRARVWYEINSGRIDMTSMGIETPARAEYAWFLPYLTTKYLATRREGTKGSWNPEDILHNDTIVIGMVRSFKHGSVVDALIDNVRRRNPDRIVEVPDELALFRLLKAGRVQLVFAERHLFDYAVAALNIDDAVQTDIAPEEGAVSRCLVLSKARFSQEEMLKWKRLLDGMVRDGTIRTILSRYLPSRDVPDMLARAR